MNLKSFLKSNLRLIESIKVDKKGSLSLTFFDLKQISIKNTMVLYQQKYSN